MTYCNQKPFIIEKISCAEPVQKTASKSNQKENLIKLFSREFNINRLDILEFITLKESDKLLISID